jgi:membrane protease YdiL (CAAX protease family)
MYRHSTHASSLLSFPLLVRAGMRAHMATEPTTPRFASWRLAAWLTFIGVFTALGYAARFADTEEPDDLAFRWWSSVAAVVQYGIMLGILLLIAKGIPKREIFALWRPASWPRAVGYAVVALIAIYTVAFVYVSLSGADPDEEQGLVPDGWDSSRAPAFVAFFLAVVVLAPIVEELTFRGIGFTLLGSRYGTWVAILGTGVLFGAAHGLLEALPVLAFFGVAVGYLRDRTRSIYPGMLLHSSFNALALVVSVTHG